MMPSSDLNFEKLLKMYYNPGPSTPQPSNTRRKLHVATRADLKWEKDTTSPEVGLVRSSDIAFPSGDDIYDHSPSAPFVLDQKLINAAKQSRDFNYINPPDTATRPRPFGIQSVTAGPDEPLHFCTFSFGSDKSSCWSCVVCDLDTYAYLQAHPLSKKPLYAEPHVSRMPVYVADTPDGRGKGLYAARAFRTGEVLLREPPLLVTRQGFPPELITSFDSSLKKWMPKRALDAYDRLDNCWPSVDATRRLNIGRTNMVGIELPPTNTVFGGAFELLSRVNHSCDPNVTFDWDYKTFQCAIVARADITAGQELTLGYTDIDAPRAKRREELQRMFRFKCTCPVCGPD